MRKIEEQYSADRGAMNIRPSAKEIANKAQGMLALRYNYIDGNSLFWEENYQGQKEMIEELAKNFGTPGYNDVATKTFAEMDFHDWEREDFQKLLEELKNLEKYYKEQEH